MTTAVETTRERTGGANICQLPLRRWIRLVRKRKWHICWWHAFALRAFFGAENDLALRNNGLAASATILYGTFNKQTVLAAYGNYLLPFCWNLWAAEMSVSINARDPNQKLSFAWLHWKCIPTAAVKRILTIKIRFAAWRAAVKFIFIAQWKLICRLARQNYSWHTQQAVGAGQNFLIEKSHQLWFTSRTTPRPHS